MIQHLRSRLRVGIATTICALVAAPALITGTASIAAAAPPGAATAILTVNGEGTGLASNPWQFDGGAYNELKAAITNPANFGASGLFKKGSYVVPTAPISTGLSFPGTLSGLDVFFGGLPLGEYGAGEIAALQAFNADGRALVLNANDKDFGDIADFLGFHLRSERAFFGEDAVCGWTNNNIFGDPDSAPSRSAAVGSHPIQTGPFGFGSASTVTNYHTVQVFTSPLPAPAQSLYNLTVTGQAPQLAVTGPIGETSTTVAPITHVSYQSAVVAGTAHITTAALNPSGILSVAFYHDDASVPANLISTDTDFPYEANWNTAAVAPAGAADGLHAIIARVTRTVAAGGGTFDESLEFPLNVDNVAPPVTPVPGTANIDYNCPGSGGELVNNNIAGSTVAVIPAKALSANSGPIVVTSDLDSMSNAFPTSWTQNRTFTLNAFAWIMDQIVPDFVPPPPPPPPAAQTYFALPSPIRVYDSRLTGGAIPSGVTRNVKVTDLTVNGIAVPADATSIVANVTAVDPDEAGFLTVYPFGSVPPLNTSTHNFSKGENFANTVVMAVGTGGNISILNQFYTGTGDTHVLVDVIGYSRADSTGSKLRTISPIRALDSRAGTGGPKEPFHARAARELTIVGQPGIPANVKAVVLNMTVDNATNTGSFVTVWPSGGAQPNISNINIIAGVTRANLVVAGVGPNGKISIVNDSGDTNILADIVGYFEPAGTGGSITGLTPTRILDTRSPRNNYDEGQARSYTVAGVGGIPAGAKTAILKVTAVQPTNDGYLTVWPAGTSTPPNVSNLNFGPGMTIPNLVVTQIGTNGQINIYNAFGSTDVLIDVLGYAD